MKHLIRLAAGLGAMLAMHGALAGTINDDFTGKDSAIDSLGGASYEITKATITRVGSVLTVVVYTGFAGKAGTTSPTVGYGDLFLSDVWNPVGTAADRYAATDASVGTVWKYALHIEDNARTNNMGSGLSLYQLNGAANSNNIWNSDNYIPTTCVAPCDYRNGQAVGVKNPGTNSSVALLKSASSTNKWVVDASAGTVTFQMDVAGTALLNYQSMAIHWGETCQNDVIEGYGRVPEPASLALLGAGLCGFLTMRRRKKIA